MPYCSPWSQDQPNAYAWSLGSVRRRRGLLVRRARRPGKGEERGEREHAQQWGSQSNGAYTKPRLTADDVAVSSPSSDLAEPVEAFDADA